MIQTLSDEELMLEVRNDAVDSLAALFDRYHVALFNFFLRLTGDAAASEDLVQDTFYRLLKYRATYKPGTSFRTWMYQVARNVRTDMFHRRRNETGLEHAPLPTVLPVDTVEAQQDMLRLKEALLELSEDKREVLVLSRFQELKYDEIARVLRCETGTVKVRVHRALQELKELMLRRQRIRPRTQENTGG